MYDARSDSPAEAHTSGMCADLGQVLQTSLCLTFPHIYLTSHLTLFVLLFITGPIHPFRQNRHTHQKRHEATPLLRCRFNRSLHPSSIFLPLYEDNKDLMFVVIWYILLQECCTDRHSQIS
jgi:hypothetical protein